MSLLNRAIAEFLNIDYELIENLDIELHENRGSSGDDLYSYYFYVPEDISDDIAEEIGWTPGETIENIPLNIIHDEDLKFELWIKSFSTQLEVFQGAILDVEGLLKVQVEDSLQTKYFQLLHVNLITILETYLSDIFISTTLSHEKYIESSFNHLGTFKNRKIHFNELCSSYKNRQKLITDELTKISWHNINIVAPLFKKILEIEISNEFCCFLREQVTIRHDIVHRNGKPIDDSQEEHIILEDDLRKLISNTEQAAIEINEAIHKINSQRST